MSIRPEHHLFRSNQLPRVDLGANPPPGLSQVLHKTLEETRAPGAAIHVNGGQSLVGRRHGDQWTLESCSKRQGVLLHPTARLRPEDRMNGGSAAPLDRVSSAEILYGEECLGSVEWLARESHETHGKVLAERLARESAFMIKRLQIEELMQKRLGLDLKLIGHSPRLRLLEEEIQRIAATDLPVIIEGELGLEKLLVACFIHFAGMHGKGPFVEVKCSVYCDNDTASPESWVDQAQGGTLFFNGVEHLPMSMQQRWPAALGSRVGQWMSTSDQDSGPIRVIASSTSDIERQVMDGKLSKSLFAELNFLRLRIPPLRERPEDIPGLADHFLSRHRRRSSQRFTEKALELLARYHWPENLFELERIVARVATMADTTTIDLDELIRHAPELVSSSSTAPPAADHRAIGSGHPDAIAAPPPAEEPALKPIEPLSGEEAAIRMAAGRLGFTETLHPGLQRAITHIAESYQEPISMGDLAKTAFISPSHLSFLFRTGLGVSFKTLLAAVRIEHAKRLLVSSPDQLITDICLEVGFFDLSHFEKTFKRWVRHSPREYRRLALKQTDPKPAEANQLG